MFSGLRLFSGTGIVEVNLLKPTSYVHHQFNIQQLYTLPTLYLCVFIFMSEQTATCAPYSKKLLVL